MIATVLTFLFGVLVTLLVAILVMPLVWRKAQSLARRDFEATIPTSANEIRAGYDRVRAEAAMSVRRQEILAARANEKSARTQAELGRGTVENVELLKRVRGLTATIEQRDSEITGLSAEAARLSAEHETLSTQLAAVQAEAATTAEELATLADRFDELGEIAEERKIQLIAAEAKLDRFADDDRALQRGEREAQSAIDRLHDEVTSAQRSFAEEKAVAAALRVKLDAKIGELADRDDEITGLKQQIADAAKKDADAASAALPQAAGTGSAGQRLRAALERQNGRADVTSASPAEIGDAISDLAARVIRMVAVSEGPTSPLAPLMKTDPAPARPGPRTLAERVALLTDPEARGAAAAAAVQPEPARPA